MNPISLARSSRRQESYTWCWWKRPELKHVYLSSSLLQQLKSLSDQVAQVESLPLAVLDMVPNFWVAVTEYIEDGQDLPVVGHQGLSYHLSWKNQLLNDLQHGSNDLGVSCVQGGCIRRKVLLIGIISWGMTGRILLPPLSSRS